jgi:hypothetical protein
MLIVGEEERKRNHFYPSPRTGRKGNISVTIEEFAEIVDAEIKRH